MSRFLLSLVLSLSTAATVLAAPAPRFAQPPGAPEAIATHATNEATGADAPTAIVDRAAVRAKLLANRRANLERFRAYQRRGIFPDNLHTTGMLNVWLDASGHLCAAATIMKDSGEAELVARIARDTNFIRLADVTDGPLMSWILTSGLTQAELVAIQKPFSGVGRRPSDLSDLTVVVDPKLRAAEDARLKKLYRQVDAAIVKHERASLELALDRLMSQPELAQHLLAT